MAAMVERTVEDLNHKLDTIKIDQHRKAFDKPEVAVNKDSCLKQEQQMHLSPTSESFPSSGSVSSCEAYGDAATLYCSSNDYPELTFVAAPNTYISSPGPIYAGSPAPVMNVNGFIPYPVEGVHYQSPVMDYNYVNQQVYSPLTAGIQFTSQGNGGYVYGPQVYQYPLQPYYQHAPVGQYVAATSGLPAGGVMMIDTQDPGLVIPNGYTNFNTYQGPIPSYPLTIVQPPNSVEEAVPLPVTYPSQTLRASAPAWIEPSKSKQIGAPKESVSAMTQPVLQLSSAVSFPPLNKLSSASPTSANAPVNKSNSPISGFKAAIKGSNQPNPLPRSEIDAKVSGEKDKATGNNSAVQPTAWAGHNKDGWATRVKAPQFAPAASTFKTPSAGLNKDQTVYFPSGEGVNSADFATKYDDAKFFIIKSYSDDNVFKSIQYNVWASTPNGNKKLDEAYQDAQRRGAGKRGGCPVFLFFSVNGSRQFCGVAEMTSAVDYNRTMEFWEQHKWSGSFQVKWCIVKDVPNSQFRRIILQNNENKPVTNSRDTQEVSLQQGLEMLNIFKSYPSRGSILDEFPAYQAPPKVVQEIKPQWSPQSFPKIGELAVKGQVADPGLKITTKLNSAAVKGCDNAPKTKEPNSFVKLVGKGPEGAAQDASVEKDKKLDKENIKMNVKEGVTVSA